MDVPEGHFVAYRPRLGVLRGEAVAAWTAIGWGRLAARA